MSDRTRRFGAGHSRGICSCGAYHSADDLGFVADPVASNEEQALAKSVENSLLVGLFPEASSRRQFLQTLGSGTALAALESFLPVGALKAMAQEKVKPEKETITIGFLPLTCATPLIMAEEMGLYAKNGLKATLAKQTSVTIIRDKLLNGELDASEQVMAVPISVTMGIGGSVADPTSVLSVCNVHGNCLVLAMRHKDNQDPKNWKGFAFGVPFEHSVQAMMLRYYVAEHGLDPDKDIKFRTIPSTEYTSQLRAGNLDGFLGGEPHGQLVVFEGGGFIHKLSRDLWTGHPCCTLAARTAWVQKNPNTFLALHRAVVAASVHVSKPENRAGISRISGACELSQHAGAADRAGDLRALCRRSRPRAHGAGSHSVRSVPVLFDGDLADDADETLGLHQGRRRPTTRSPRRSCMRPTSTSATPSSGCRLPIPIARR